VQKRHAAYREVLASLDHPAARVIEKFLNDPERPLLYPLGLDVSDEEFTAICAAEPIPEFVVGMRVKKTDHDWLGKLACVVAGTKATHPTGNGPAVRVSMTGDTLAIIEVEGHPQWWLDPEVQRVHARRLRAKDLRGADSSEKGTCSLCGQSDMSLVRLFPSFSTLGKLISFKGTAWCSHTREQAFNCPTCPDCVTLVIRGANDALGDAGTTFADGDLILCWWAEDPQGPQPWTLVEAILDRETAETDREKALTDLPDGHVAVFRKLLGRTGLYRYAPVTGAVVARNLRAWRETCGGSSPAQMAAKLSHFGERSPKGGNKNEIAQHRVDLCLLLLGAREVGARDKAHIEVLLAQSPLTGLAAHRRNYWNFLQYLINPESHMTNSETFAEHLGRAMGAATDIHYRKAKRKDPDKKVYSLWEQEGELCRKNPRRTMFILHDYLDYPAVRKEFNLATNMMGDTCPTTFNPAEQVFFLRGFARKRTEIIEERDQQFLATQAAKATPAVKADTTTNN